MALAKCRECGKEISTKARACPNCGVVIPHTSLVTGCLAVFLGLAVIGGAVSIAMSNKTTPSDPAKRAAVMGDTGVYLGAAVSYLDEARKESRAVAVTMAGVNDGSSTLGDIKSAISEARTVEDAGYMGDYQQKVAGHIPAAFAANAAKIDQTHRLFQSAMAECLQYWDDQNTAHVESGTRTFKRSVLVMNSAVTQLGNLMGALRAARAKHARDSSRVNR